MSEEEYEDEYDDEDEDEEEVCEHEWEVDRVTDWSMHGDHTARMCVCKYIAPSVRHTETPIAHGNSPTMRCFDGKKTMG